MPGKKPASAMPRRNRSREKLRGPRTNIIPAAMSALSRVNAPNEPHAAARG